MLAWVYIGLKPEYPHSPLKAGAPLGRIIRNWHAHRNCLGAADAPRAVVRFYLAYLESVLRGNFPRECEVAQCSLQRIGELPLVVLVCWPSVLLFRCTTSVCDESLEAEMLAQDLSSSQLMNVMVAVAAEYLVILHKCTICFLVHQAFACP